ncbi:hypothetical protein TNCV_806101 [Trichonephila clavipes]|nr:hypothetical protein TNCV_806101 [Trichonephila clavipes]
MVYEVRRHRRSPSTQTFVVEEPLTKPTQRVYRDGSEGKQAMERQKGYQRKAARQWDVQWEWRKSARQREDMRQKKRSEFEFSPAKGCGATKN